MEAKIRIKHSGGTIELSFDEAQDLFRNNSKSFEIVDKDKYKFQNNELIKLPKKKKETKDK